MIGCDFGSCACVFGFGALFAVNFVSFCPLCLSSFVIISSNFSSGWYGTLLIVSLCSFEFVAVSLVVCWG